MKSMMPVDDPVVLYSLVIFVLFGQKSPLHSIPQRIRLCLEENSFPNPAFTYRFIRLFK